MPSYDMLCNACGADISLTCSIAARDEFVCDCGGELRNVIRPSALCGPMWDKTVTIGGANKTFTNGADLRNYERQMEAEGTVIVSRSSSDWARIRDRANEDGEKAAQRAGFRDTQHFSRVAKEAKRRGADYSKPQSVAVSD